MNDSQKIMGIMGAMPEEMGSVIAMLSDCKRHQYGQRVYYQGYLYGIPTVAVISGWGKVAAAATVSALIHVFHIHELVFTGVAGAISPDLNVGDVVVGKRLVQHDMDARPLMSQFEIPSLRKVFMEVPSSSFVRAVSAVEKLINDAALSQHILGLKSFGIQKPRLFIGDIAGGDKFFSGHDQKQALLKQLPSILCVEMEGAAVAQVCCEYEIPFVVIRTISDTADEHSPIDFNAFIKEVAGFYTNEIIRNIYRLLNK